MVDALVKAACQGSCTTALPSSLQTLRKLDKDKTNHRIDVSNLSYYQGQKLSRIQIQHQSGEFQKALRSKVSPSRFFDMTFASCQVKSHTTHSWQNLSWLGKLRLHRRPVATCPQPVATLPLGFSTPLQLCPSHKMRNTQLLQKKQPLSKENWLR